MQKPNKLIDEKSPYLQQHAYNPVNWYPWCGEAFEKAEREDKPVFLSIGYSTCHWCHVMEKESFEDEEVAELMNKYFISVKVDKEERPDIDNVYMAVCQIYTGSGGWPTTVIMTPDKKPFFAGTYFSKTERFGRPGMIELLTQIYEFWTERRSDILNSAAQITDTLKKMTDNTSGEYNLDSSILLNTAVSFENTFDKQHGGFNIVPKFPTPHTLTFLLCAYKRFGKQEYLDMVVKTLLKMRLGGIYDQIGYGYHRYSTDKQWLVPHFEKMLYDQALICAAYTEAWLISKNEMLKKTAVEIIEYVLRDMSLPEGGFYSAEDADSEGQEGKFYLWKTAELEELFDEDDYKLLCEIFNVKEEGNFIDPLKGAAVNENILHLTDKEYDPAILMNDPDGFYSKAIKVLFEYRDKRSHPFKDEKILTDWNSLMISALCKAGKAFGKNKFINAAIRNYDFIRKNLFAENNFLLHRYKEGEAAIPAAADDYAFLINALIELYSATFEVSYLKDAVKLNNRFIEKFTDEDFSGFYFTSAEAEQLIVRKKEIYDGAVPSSNSIAVMNLLKLSKYTGNSDLEEKAYKMQKYFAKSVSAYPNGYTQFLQSVDFSTSKSTEIVIVCKIRNSEVDEIIRYLNTSYFVSTVILLKTDTNAKELSEAAPYTEPMAVNEGNLAVYVCTNFMCNAPVNNLTEFIKLIEKY